MSDELIVIEREDALKAFTDEQAFEAMFTSIKALAEEVKPDLTSAKGRKEHKSFCFKIRKTKARIDDVRTDLTEDMRKQISAINARGAAMVERLEELHTTVRQPLTDWEEAEKLRVETIRKTIEDARSLGQVRFGETSRQIQDRMDKLPTHDLDWYAEFKDEADLVIQAAFNGLSIAKTAALNAEKEAAEREAERAELARLKKAEEERLAKERAAEEERKAEEARRDQAQREADEKVAAERAEAERKQAELQRQLDEANRKAADAEKTAKEAQEREAKAVEDERRRQDEERAAEERRVEDERIKAEQQAEEDRKIAAERDRRAAAAEACIEESKAKAVQALFPFIQSADVCRQVVDAIAEKTIPHLVFEA
ncbi:hypothetical protein ASE36_00380 [Rhizobium sp. Root274]|uniref:hypothetical protein n=1 Tax=unclassified Rhizobium TaxID=2613769 RepID=UPI000715EC05|nr:MULTISPECIES: hypothetical protein [unclassified Rhizobium]KQW30795.1 hypothetical protein ASC71_00380 [Rhizobium sp. Root1240]KRD32342.1 hypothetical protein ASE36_00380 [Rhizobium sp. Root274]